MLGLKRRVRVETERLTLRLPEHGDWRQWSELRETSAEFLVKWEPVWANDHLTRRAFTNRVYWAQRAEAQGQALPMLLIRREDQQLLGALTLDNIRRGPAQTGTFGYWIGQGFARQGYMREAILALTILPGSFGGSPFGRASTFSMPSVTCPQTVYWPSRKVASSNTMKN